MVSGFANPSCHTWGMSKRAHFVWMTSSVVELLYCLIFTISFQTVVIVALRVFVDNFPHFNIVQGQYFKRKRWENIFLLFISFSKCVWQTLFLQNKQQQQFSFLWSQIIFVEKIYKFKQNNLNEKIMSRLHKTLTHAPLCLIAISKRAANGCTVKSHSY